MLQVLNMSQVINMSQVMMLTRADILYMLLLNVSIVISVGSYRTVALRGEIGHAY